MSGTTVPAAWLAARGGQAGALRGREAVLSFGDVAAEARALAEEAGLVPLLGRTWVQAAGADAGSYLHRMLTQDVAGLAPGHGAAACSLTSTGRILGRLLLWRDAAGLALDFDPGAAASALPGLERYVIADDVAFRDESAGVVRALLLGPGALAALEAAGLGAPARGGIVEGALGGGPLAALALGFGALEAFELRLDAAHAQAQLEALARRARPAGEAALDVLRVEQGVPAYGAELDERILPNEARLDEALSFTKGCYPGQEPVVMAKHRGHPSTLLVRLEAEDGAPLTSGEALLLAQAPVGRVTTAVVGRDGRARALGFVRHARAGAGTVLQSATGRTLRIL